MFFIRVFFILISAISFLFHEESFATYSGSESTISTSGSTNENANTIEEAQNTEKNTSTGSQVDENEEKENPKILIIEKNLQKLILEFAKIQGDNSLKNITQSFKKINPDTKSLLATYSGLQSQFSRIKKNIIDEGLIHSVRGEIIVPYCEYMIEALEKKKKNTELN